MAVLLSETYEALKEAGASEARAGAAAEEIAAFESRLVRVETELHCPTRRSPRRKASGATKRVWYFRQSSAWRRNTGSSSRAGASAG